MSRQLPLGLSLNDAARLGNFLTTDNDAVIHSLLNPDEQYVYIWGASGVGKSHLLHACCYEFLQADKSVFYLSLTDDSVQSPEVLENIAQYDLVCLDDIEAVVKYNEWESRLFHLYNEIRDSGHCLRVASSCSATALPLQLPDLVSRLCWGPVYQLRELADAQKIQALQLRAANRGMAINNKVARYLIQHSTRDMHSLFDLLDKLDKASISEQRKLTIPFVKQYI